MSQVLLYAHLFLQPRERDVVVCDLFLLLDFATAIETTWGPQPTSPTLTSAWNASRTAADLPKRVKL